MKKKKPTDEAQNKPREESDGNPTPDNSGLDFFSSLNIAGIKEAPFPGKDPSEYRVFIAKEVYEAILSHSKENSKVELGGVLVGDVMKDAYGPYLAIENSIRAEGSRNQGEQITFTHATWDYIHQEMDSRFSGKRIVGWYHTHPAFGIFLSGMDKFIHDFFFNQPFQVAMVVDPISRAEGLFAWVNGSIKAMGRCWVGDEVRTLTKGRVGSDALADEQPMCMAAPLPQRSYAAVPDRDDNPRVSAPMLLLAFFLGALLTATLLSMQLRSSFREAAGAEIREVLTLVASGLSNQASFQTLDDRLAELENSLPQAPAGNATASASTETATNEVFAATASEVTLHKARADVAETRKLVASLASATARFEHQIRSTLSAKTVEATTLQERLLKMQGDMEVMRSHLAASFLLQADMTLSLYGGQNAPPQAKAHAKSILDAAIQIAPGIEPQCRSKFPELFAKQGN